MNEGFRGVRRCHVLRVLSLLVLAIVVVTTPAIAQPPSLRGAQRASSRDFIEQQRQRSDQMMRDARVQSDRMMSHAEARSAQIRRDLQAGRTPSGSYSNRSTRRSPRIRARTIRGLIALALLIGGGLYKLASSSNQSSQPAPIFQNQAEATPASNEAAAISNDRGERRDTTEYDTTSPLTGLADKIKRR